MKRRDFLKRAGVAVAASTALSPAVFANQANESSGLTNPMLCVTLDYYNTPSGDIITKLYDYLLAEVDNWNADTNSIVASHLYQHLLLGSPKYMLLLWFKDTAEVARFVDSDPYDAIHSMAVDAGLTLNANIFTYDRGEENGFGGG